MSAVLIASRKKGRSGWIAARGAACLQITGMQEGDVIHILLMEEGKDDYDAMEFRGKADVKVDLPCCQFVRAVHIENSGHPIYIDLLR